MHYIWEYDVIAFIGAALFLGCYAFIAHKTEGKRK